MPLSFPRILATQEGVRRSTTLDTLVVTQESHFKWSFAFGNTTIYNDEISSIACDSIAFTLSISRTNKDVVVFSFRDDDPNTFISRLDGFVERTADDGFCKTYKARELNLIHSNPIEETVFDTFAKVANTYVDIASNPLLYLLFRETCWY